MDLLADYGFVLPGNPLDRLELTGERGGGGGEGGGAPVHGCI